MEKFTITSPIITIETEEQRVLLHKLYPGKCHPDPQNHVLIAQEFTLEELDKLKRKMQRAKELVDMGNYRIYQIELLNLNRAQAIYLKQHNKGIVYDRNWYDVTGQIDEGIDHPTIPEDKRGPFRVNIIKALTKNELNALYAELDKLK